MTRLTRTHEKCDICEMQIKERNNTKNPECSLQINKGIIKAELFILLYIF